MTYLTTLLTTDSFNKEVKLFTLGDHFIDRYRTVSDRVLRGNAEATRPSLPGRRSGGDR